MTTFVLKYSRHLSINYDILQFERNFVDLQYSLEQITSYLEGLILSIWIYTCKHTHTHMCVCAKSLQSCPTLYGHMVCSFCPWDSAGENTGVGCHALLQGIFLITDYLRHCPNVARETEVNKNTTLILNLKDYLKVIEKNVST